MRKKLLLFCFVALLVSGLQFAKAASPQSMTHLRITPGVIEIHDTFSNGTYPDLYVYTLKNSSAETKTIELSATGYLKVSKSKVTLKPQETTTFTLYAVVPKKAKEGKRVDYVEAKTTHKEGMTSLKLSAKVTYHIKKEPWHSKLFPANWANGDSAFAKALYQLSVHLTKLIECHHLYLFFGLLVVGWVLQRFRYLPSFTVIGHILWWAVTFVAWLIACATNFFGLIVWGIFAVIYRIIEKRLKKNKEEKEEEKEQTETNILADESNAIAEESKNNEQKEAQNEPKE